MRLFHYHSTTLLLAHPSSLSLSTWVMHTYDTQTCLHLPSNERVSQPVSAPILLYQCPALIGRVLFLLFLLLFPWDLPEGRIDSYTEFKTRPPPPLVDEAPGRVLLFGVYNCRTQVGPLQRRQVSVLWLL